MKMKIYNQVNIFGLGDDDAIDIEAIRQSGATAGFQSGYTDGYASYECEDAYRGMYLTFGIISGGTIVWKTSDSSFTRTIEYSKNGVDWTSITSSIEGVAIEVEAGDKVEFRGNNRDYSNNTFGDTTAVFEVYGNIMSLNSKTDFPNITDLWGKFSGFFKNCTGLTLAKNLVLPATRLMSSCYLELFNGCTNLTQGPKLPATTLAADCYSNMFQNCTSLTIAPELPATALTQSCYWEMFRGCTSLTTAPELPATDIATSCYVRMFSGCTSLTQAPELPATTLYRTCYESMFRGCTNLTTAPELPASGTAAQACYFSMFRNCINLTQAPSILPATTLDYACYESMFQGCTSLTSAPALPATTLAQRSYYYMFSDCTSLNYIKCLATDISASSCTNGWAYNVSANGTFVKDPNMSSWKNGGYYGIPSGWTIVDAE